MKEQWLSKLENYLTDALKGCPFRREDVAAVLEQADLRSMFGGITKEELLDLMFHIDA